MIHEAEKELKSRWLSVFAVLPEDSRRALYDALVLLRVDALQRAEHQWKKHKAPLALYWKALGVYAGHLARVIRKTMSK